MEELESSFAPDVVEEVLGEALDGGESLDTRDAIAMLAFADGPLRSVLRRRLGESAGGALADSACALISPRRTAPSSSQPPKRDSIFPSVPDLDEASAIPPSVAVFQSDAGVRPTTLRTVQSQGVTVVVLGSPRMLARSAAAEWVDVFVVSSTLSIADARELGRWVDHREKPASVVVWPSGTERPAFEGVLRAAVACPTADALVLADIVWREVAGVRGRARTG